MTRTKKLNKKFKEKEKVKGKGKGGKLILRPTDLKNNKLCGLKMKEIDYTETPGYEIYVAIDSSFQLNTDTLGFFMFSFKKNKNKWFKFVVFENDGIKYIYIINGAPINKHTVCFIEGLLEVTNEKNEYPEIKIAYDNLINDKGVNGIRPGDNSFITTLNNVINTELRCMPLISAGSGTINDNGSICINTKSGHYKPDIKEMEEAKEIFQTITGKQVNVILKEDKELLKQKYGNKYTEYSGICL